MPRVGYESKLIAAAQRGDVSAFNQLVQVYQEVVYHTAFRVLGDVGAAASTTQAAFLAAHRHLRAFEGGPFKLWLLRILFRCCRQIHPKADRETRRATRQVRLYPDPQSLDAILQSCLEYLPLEDRITAILSDVQGLAYEEIAHIMETSPATVACRLKRARYGLRAFFLAQPELASAHNRLNSGTIDAGK